MVTKALRQPPYATWCPQPEKAGPWCPRLEMELLAIAPQGDSTALALGVRQCLYYVTKKVMELWPYQLGKEKSFLFSRGNTVIRAFTLKEHSLSCVQVKFATQIC